MSSFADKSDQALRTIGEVAKELDVPAYVIRFWEKNFAEIKPIKRDAGRRYYRPEDVTALKNIQRLLHKEGFTIKGAQKFLKGQIAKDNAPSTHPIVHHSPSPFVPASIVPAAAVKDIQVVEEIVHQLRLIESS